jgi:hypothetical protein
LAEEFQIGKRGLTAERSKVIADLVLEDTTKPASFGRFAAKAAGGSDGGKERFLNQIFCDLGSPHAKESIPVKAITMLVNPTLGVESDGGSARRAFDFWRWHLQSAERSSDLARKIFQRGSAYPHDFCFAVRIRKLFRLTDIANEQTNSSTSAGS